MTIDISCIFTILRVIGLKSSLIYVCVIICSNNGLEPNRRQIIAQTDIDISSDLKKNTFKQIRYTIQMFFSEELRKFCWLQPCLVNNSKWQKL